MSLTMNPNVTVNSGYPNTNMMMNNGYASTNMSMSNGYTSTTMGMNNMYPTTNLNNPYASANATNMYPSANTNNAYPSGNPNNVYPPSVTTNNAYPNPSMNNVYPIRNTSSPYPNPNPNMSNGYTNMNMGMSNGYTSPPPWAKQEPVYHERVERIEKVEMTTPIMYKRKKLTRADIGPVEAWRIMMALRSSLLAERCWALDVLNSLLFDDTSVQYFGLAHLPGLLDVLLEHFAQSLADMFDSSLVEEELCCFYQNMEELDNDTDLIVGPVNPKDRTKILSCSNYTFLTRNRRPVKLVTSSSRSPIVNGQNKKVTKDHHLTGSLSSSRSSSSSSSCAKVSTVKNDTKVNDSIVLEKDEMRIKVRDPAGILKRRMSDYEDESYTRDEGTLHLLSDTQDNLAQRCVCLSTILRNLTFIPGNESEFARNSTFLSLLGKLLLLHHEHPTHKKRDYERDEDADFLDTNSGNLHNEDEWWWGFLYHIRENVLVMAANISGYTDLSQYPEKISRPVIDGLLHWAICPAAHGQDPLPTVSSNSTLSPQRLALEALCKLCVTKNNVDLVVATPPYSRFQRLCSVLSRLLHRNEEQVLREFAVTLLDFLSSADSGLARTIALQTPCVNLLVSFVEQAESIGLGIANRYGIAALRDNPESMGTSLDMLRRAADTLLHLSRHPDNRTLLLQHETRLLSLSMSQILDQKVTAIVTQVLFQCSRGNS